MRVAVDASGGIYVAGLTSGGLDGNISLGSNDAFIVKYVSSGTKVWIRQFGTSFNDGVRDIVMDGAGNVYVAGRLWRGNFAQGLEEYFVVNTIRWERRSGGNRWLQRAPASPIV